MEQADVHASLADVAEAREHDECIIDDAHGFDTDSDFGDSHRQNTPKR